MMMGKRKAIKTGEKAVQIPHPSWDMDWLSDRSPDSSKAHGQPPDAATQARKDKPSPPRPEPVSMGQVLGIALFLSGSQWHDTHKIFRRKLPAVVRKFLDQADRLTLERCVVEAMTRLNQTDLSPTRSAGRTPSNKRKKA
ncbi:MAG: hypothetical protein IT442_01035 [Phycisphaeraceae bacterium]|nr:hypothetical protein [Phycisphaeraceae bacterium]